jgi:hypothetical protein
VLPIADVLPAGQDPLEKDEYDENTVLKPGTNPFGRQPPLLVALNSPAPDPQAAVPRFFLQGEETTTAGTSQKLKLTLLRPPGSPSGESGASTLIVLDRQPLLLSAVAGFRNPLETVNPSTVAAPVAVWDSSDNEGAAWKLDTSTVSGAGSGRFALILPPQTIGEAMEKGKPPRFDDVAPGGLVDFRFSPAARFELLSSPFRQNYTEPPWNLRRILGFPGQRDPGARVVDLRFELFYGLTTRITSADRDDRLRLSEIAARLGEIPG